MIRRLYEWTLYLAEKPNALWFLFIIAFLESSVFPIPPDVMIVPMALAVRKNAWRIATLATLGSTLGAVFGYCIGMFLFDAVGRPLIAFYGYNENFSNFQTLYDQWGIWLVLLAGVSPIPFKVITIASGVLSLDIILFVIAAAIGRGSRFYLEALLLWKFGESIKAFLERYLTIAITAFIILFFLGFLAVGWLL